MKIRTWKFLRNSAVRGLTALTVVLALFAAMGPQPVLAAGFTVNSTADTVDASPGNGVCADASNNCTLRAAIMEANALSGPDSLTLPSGTYLLTLANAGGANEDSNATGDLDINDSLTINGAGSGSTIIEAGTNTSNGIDKVIGANPTCASGVNVTITGVTVRFGRNTQPINDPNFSFTGGGIDWCAGGTGGTFTLSDSVVSDNTNVNGYGGGLNVDTVSSPTTVNITNVTFSNNQTLSTVNTANGGAINLFGDSPTINITNSTFTNNHTTNATSGGGAIYFRPTTVGHLTVTGSTFTSNTAAGIGGAIATDTHGAGTIITIGTSTFTGNTATNSFGGALDLDSTNLNTTPFSLSHLKITGNTAGISGGGVYVGHSNVTMSKSLIVGNSAPTGSGIHKSVDTATATVTNNWWGCSTGPGAAPCDTATTAGGTLTFTPWYRNQLTASTSPIVTNQSTSLTASFLTTSAGSPVPTVDLTEIIGRSVTWAATHGNLSSPQGSVQSAGTATGSFQATSAGTAIISAKVDNDNTAPVSSNVLSLTVNKADTTAAILDDSPDPTVTGEPYSVAEAVTGSAGNSPTVPTGNVVISDGTDSCTVIEGGITHGCLLTSFTAGNKTLTATYQGDSNFNASPASAGVAHTVNKADTTTTITSHNPDPSVVGQSVTFAYNVTVSAPGSGTPTGNVTVSDGTVSCTATVAAGQCSIAFTSAGAKSLTATYAGDANYNGNTSAAQSHQVNKADTTTAITSDTPDPSDQNSAVTVNFTVTVNAPGSGTPTGNVTVSDGVDSCIGTVSSGTCTITLTTAGARTLTASYAGDGNFNGSTSAGESHTVNNLATTTTITSDTPDPSVVGQAVTVQYSVTAASGTPTGNVTVSDGTSSCTASVSAGQCSLIFTSAGAKSLTATYAGDGTFSASTSAVEPHQVNKADTATTITSDTPDPSNVNEAVTVNFTAAPVAPGAGTPTGNVTVSDGVDSCAGTVAAGQCLLTLTTAGSRTLTASYAGDSNFNASASAGEPHTVNVPDTTPPDVTINQAAGQSDPTTTSPINFTVVFSEPVSGFGDAASDVDLSLSTAPGTLTASITPVDAMTYTVSVSGMTGNGTVIASIPVNAATDAGSNGNTASTSTDNSVTFVFSSPTSLLYNGSQIVNIGDNLQLAAKLSSTSAACVNGQTISFSLDTDPTTGAQGTYSLGSAVTNSSGQASISVSTSGWLEGIYLITVNFAGTANCDPSSDSATLTVASPGNSATGGGWYTLPGSGRNNFGFNVRKVDNKCKTNCAYKGNLLFMNNGKWKLRGTLASYSKLSTGQGAASGVGDLYWWDASQNGGLGDWVLAQSGVAYTINFYDSGAKGKTSTDKFGINIQYVPVPPQPASLPNSGPTLLKGGDIKVQ